MKIESFIVKNPPPQKLQKRMLDVSRAINGRIEFGSPSNGPVNIQGFWEDTITPGVADTEFTVNHNLGYIPTGMLVVAVDKAAIIYTSRKNQWTTTQAFFKCNQATVNLQGFVI